jgi:hypothetical protein
MELYKIFEGTLLAENRIKQVIAKYPNLKEEDITFLSRNDPSGNNKYLDWMASQQSEGGNPSSIISAVRIYHEKMALVNKLNVEAFLQQTQQDLDNEDAILNNPKDINSYTLDDLQNFAKFLQNLISKRKEIEEIKKESDTIYENKSIVVLSPRTHRASCHYGIHSGWCVATANTGHFANYTKNGTLYFFLSKKDEQITQYWADETRHQKAGVPPFKTALLLRDNGEISWWSKGDHNYTNGWVGDPKLPFLTKDIADRIMAHNKHAIENRKQREIERVRLASGFYKKTGGDSSLKNDFAGFVRSDIFSPEQLKEIVRNDNWLALYEDGETGKNVRRTLTTKVVFGLLRELIVSSDRSSLPDFLKDLHSQEFFSKYSNNFSEGENRELAGSILKTLGRVSANDVGGDVKLYVDKWTMTPEQWKKYSTTSTYFFVGRIEDGLLVWDNFKKLDRFNPADHHEIKVMTMTAKFKKLNVYALTTEKDLLDSYIGDNDIPENILRDITPRAVKIYPQG